MLHGYDFLTVGQQLYISTGANEDLDCAVLFDWPSCRPHDRVPLKEMKSDWHACLDNEVGFKVIGPWFCST